MMSALENKAGIIVIDAEGICANRVGAIRRAYGRITRSPRIDCASTFPIAAGLSRLLLTTDCGGLDWFLFEMMSTDIQRRFVMPATVEMKDHVYKILELVGSSEKGIDDAIQNAISRASKTIRGMKWFEVVQTRGHIEKGAVGHYQVTLRVGFTLEE
jgi:dodecin